MARQGAGMDMQPLQRSLQGTTRFNGSPAGTNEYTLDGTPNTQRGNGPAGGGASVLPSTEVVQEVRVQTATFDASIGHTGGATVDMVLKSGGNQYRGAAYGFIRDPGWNANSWQANRGGTPRPDFTFRRWGFHGGGPTTIPGLYKGKDRTFFYYGWESWSSFSPNPPFVMSVPRPAHLSGDFSDLLALGARYQLYDPSTARAAPNGRIQRDPLPGNRIPSNRLDPAAQAFNRLWLAPNTAGTADGQNNFTYTGISILGLPDPNSLHQRLTPVPDLIRIPFPRAGQCLRMASFDHRTKTKTDNMPVSSSSFDTSPSQPPFSQDFHLSGPIFTPPAAPRSAAPCSRTAGASDGSQPTSASSSGRV